jgi:hypothetical protein
MPPQCVTCGCELHPERALKFNYMARECQDKNAKGLTMVAVGVNKAAEQYLILDEVPARNWLAANTMISGGGHPEGRVIRVTASPSPRCVGWR